MTDKPPGARWLRAKEASAYTGISVSTLAKLRCFGGGPRYVKRGVILYAQRDLDAWLEARAFTSTSAYAKAS